MLVSCNLSRLNVYMAAFVTDISYCASACGGPALLALPYYCMCLGNGTLRYAECRGIQYSTGSTRSLRFSRNTYSTIQISLLEKSLM